MGTPKFYFFPQPDGTRLFEIDLGETLAEMFSEFQVDSTTAVSFDGGIYRQTSVNREIITIQRDRFLGGEDLAIKFAALQSHLDRGFSCAFASDSARAWCYPIVINPNSGDSSVVVGGDPFRGFAGLYSPLANDYVSIASQNPELLKELNKVDSSFSSLGWNVSQGGQIPLTNNVAFSYSQAAWIHQYRYFPVLKRPQEDIGQNIITNEGGRLFSLRIRLVVDYSTWFSHHPLVGAYQSQSPVWIGSSPVAVGGQITLDGSSSSGTQITRVNPYESIRPPRFTT